jgi:hypothetical protein
MKYINTSTFNFPGVIMNNFLYVDKTAYVGKLVSGRKGEFLLTRPRRFGKSLLVSTLKAIFQGRRELFKGLAIDKMDYDWKWYPVIHLDFGACDAKTAADMEVYLTHLLEVAADALGLKLRGVGASIRFENLIRDVAKVTGTSVVVLVDEYDKPILGNIDNKEHRDDILAVLKGFYSVIKTYEGLVRFAFITGVSKFSHVSLFSDLNNLTDITLSGDYAGMLGFTEAEIRQYFADRIPLAAKAKGMAEEQLMENILTWYDGYRFSNGETHVCNPVSVSTFFSNDYNFANYWGKTGMPTFLLKLARNTRFNFEKALSTPVSDLVFGSYELDNLDPMGLLWQTGYLTIKDVLPGPLGSNMYRLGFPDYEVEQSFNTQLLAYYSGRKDGETAGVVFQLMTLIRENRIEDFMKALQAYFASIPYDIRGGDEHYYQTIFFITFLLLGGEVEAESRTSDGRIDAVVATRDHVFIFEFKLDKPAPAALEQIEDKEYYLKYQASDKVVSLVGASFDREKGKLTDWIISHV